MQAWEDALAALASDDLGWLTTRLDAFIKYRLFSAVLADAGYTWADLPNDRRKFCELVLIDHSYHSFCDPGSRFEELDRAGHLDHRVGAAIEAGTEAEPFVPETRTRARARARWIKEHSSRDAMFVSWSFVKDCRTRRYRGLENPFATEYGPWEARSRG